MDQSGTFEQIMERIIFGLTGDHKKDLPYLMETGKSFQNHPLQKEIIRGIGRLVAEILPPDKKEELDKVCEKHLMHIDSILEEAEFLIHKKEYNKAFAILERHYQMIRDSYESDSKSVYYHFNNILEEIVWDQINKTSLEVRRTPEDLPSFYLLYGSLLFELKRYSEAREMLKKGLQFNPVSTAILFEYAETFKVSKEFDEYLKITADALSFAYQKKDIARAYRNYGYYYIEMERFDIAMDLYFLSLQYDENNSAKGELFYIAEKTGTQPVQPTPEKLFGELEKENIQLGPNEHVLNVLAALIKHVLKENAFDAARYFLTIAYELTDDEKILDLLNNLPAENEEENT